MLFDTVVVAYLLGCLVQYVVLCTVVSPDARKAGGDFLFCIYWPYVWYFVIKTVGPVVWRRWFVR